MYVIFCSSEMELVLYGFFLAVVVNLLSIEFMDSKEIFLFIKVLGLFVCGV